MKITQHLTPLIIYALATLGISSSVVAGESTPAPDALRLVLASPEEVLDSSILAKLRPSDTDSLLREFRKRSLPSQRKGIAVALGYAGGKGAFEALTNSLTIEFQGNPLSDDDEVALERGLTGLGILGQNDDRAFAFLKEATRPQTWLRLRKWHITDAEADRNLHGALTSVSIHVVGLTGREELRGWLYKMKKEDYRLVYPGGSYRSFRGDVLQAAFYLETYQRLGKDEFRKQVFGGRAEALEVEWKRTQSAIEWYRWAYPPEHVPSFWKNGRLREPGDREGLR
jgi:hypothetical protein